MAGDLIVDVKMMREMVEHYRRLFLAVGSQHRSRLTMIFAAPLFLTGCVGALVPVQTVETTGIHVVEVASTIPIISAQSAKTMQELGEVVGYSCKNKLWDPAATADAATYQVKIVAAQRGATAITNLKCEEGSVSLITNCWQSYTCKAISLH